MPFRIFLAASLFIPTIVIGSITKLVLINTESGDDLLVLGNASVVDVATRGTNLSIRAETDELFLQFDLDGGASVRVESKYPFVLAGKSSVSGKPYPSNSLVQHGQHTLTVSPRSDGLVPVEADEGRSLHGSSIVVQFEVVNGLNAPVFQDEDPIAGPDDGFQHSFVDVPEIPFSAAGTISYWNGVVSIGFSGPVASETSTTDPTPFRRSSPFADYRLELSLFLDNNSNFTIPCYYAGAGMIAANTHATSGPVWFCHWRLLKGTQVSYKAHFTQGTNVVLPESLGDPAGFMDGSTATLMQVEESLGTQESMFLEIGKKGGLQYKNGTGFEAFGIASPNILDYGHFDGLDMTDSFMFEEHEEDFSGEFHTWAHGKGTGLIGALEYLSESGVNAISVRPTVALASASKDGEQFDIFFDTSRLAQWKTVLTAASELGMVLVLEIQSHAMTEEMVLFVRELVARFGHLPLIWNILGSGDELIRVIRQLDPYKHPVVSGSKFTRTSSFAQILTQPKPAGLLWKARTDDFREIDWSLIVGARRLIRPLFPLVDFVNRIWQ